MMARRLLFQYSALFLMAISVVTMFFYYMPSGNTDDKTFYFSTSSLSYFESGYLAKRNELSQSALNQCKTDYCLYATAERISAYTNYILYSFVMNITYKFYDYKSDFLERVSLTYNTTFIILFLLPFIILLSFNFIGPDEDRWIAFAIFLGVFMYSGISKYSSTYINLFPFLNGSSYLTSIYVPRGPHGLFFLASVFSYFTHRKVLFIFSVLCLTLMHIGQAPFLLLLLFIAILVEILFLKKKPTLYKYELALLTILGLGSVFWTLAFYKASTPTQLLEDFNGFAYFNAWTLKRFLLNSPLIYLLVKCFRDKNIHHKKYLILGVSGFLLIEVLCFIADGITIKTAMQTTLQQLNLRLGSIIYPTLLAINFLILLKYLKKPVLLLTIVIFMNSYLVFKFIRTDKEVFAKIDNNIYAIRNDLKIHFDNKNYPYDRYNSLSLENLEPDNEVLFHLYMFQYFTKMKNKE